MAPRVRHPLFAPHVLSAKVRWLPPATSDQSGVCDGLAFQIQRAGYRTQTHLCGPYGEMSSIAIDA